MSVGSVVVALAVLGFSPPEGPHTDRPEYVRLHGFDGEVHEGRYDGLDGQQAYFILDDPRGETIRVPRESVVRVEVLEVMPDPRSGVPGTLAPEGPRPLPPLTLGEAPQGDDALERRYSGRAMGFSLGAGLGLGAAMAVRMGYISSISDVECDTNWVGETECSRGPRLFEPAVLTLSWPLMAAGMTFAGLAGNNFGRASAITDPDGKNPRAFRIAGALTLTAGLGYFALSRIGAIVNVTSLEPRHLITREVNFAASSTISYVGAGLLGFGVSRGSHLRRRMSIAPVVTRDLGMVMVTVGG